MFTLEKSLNEALRNFSMRTTLAYFVTVTWWDSRAAFLLDKWLELLSMKSSSWYCRSTRGQLINQLIASARTDFIVTVGLPVLCLGTNLLYTPVHLKSQKSCGFRWHLCFVRVCRFLSPWLRQHSASWRRTASLKRSRLLTDTPLMSLWGQVRAKHTQLHCMESCTHLWFSVKCDSLWICLLREICRQEHDVC